MILDFSYDEFNQYRVDLPYPDVVVLKPNTHYARLVSGAYAGRGSETTAITQYISHRYFTSDYPDVFVAYKYIALVETVHQELLGKLIKNLGLKPLFFSYETNHYWNGSYPDYKYTLNKILQSDIQGEKNAIAHYTRLIKQIDDESIRNLFRRIILDEEKHIEVLTHLYASNI